MIRRPPRSTLDRSSAASDVYKRQDLATTNSQDPGSAQNGGDLGTFAPGAMVGPFNDAIFITGKEGGMYTCLLYTSPSPRDRTRSRMPSSA